MARQSGRDGAVHMLLSLPDEKLPLSMGSIGPHLTIADGRLQVVVYAAVTPRDRGDELRGALAVAQAPDLSSFAARLEALGVAARIELGGQSATLGGGEVPEGTAGARVSLASAAPETAMLAIVRGAATAGRRSRPILGPLALLLLSLTGAALLWRRNDRTRRPATAPSLPLPRAPVRAPPQLPPPTPARRTPPDRTAEPIRTGSPIRGTPRAGAPAQIVPPISATKPPPAPDGNNGTPVVIDSEDSTGSFTANKPQTARPSGKRSRPTTTTMLPTQLFEVPQTSDRPRLRSIGAPIHEDALGKEYRALFLEFVNMRRACREPVDNLDADRFVAALRRQRDELRQKYAPKEIQFHLAFDNGKAAIRFTAT